MAAEGSGGASRRLTMAAPSITTMKGNRKRLMLESKDKAILIRVTEKERATLKRKARKFRMPMSELVRLALIHSDLLTVISIDVAPLRELCYELTKQGTNLNQLARMMNTYGADAYNREEVNRLLNECGELYLRIGDAMIAIEKELETEHIYVTHPRYDDDDL